MAAIEFGFTLKRVRDITITYSQLISQFSNIHQLTAMLNLRGGGGGAIFLGTFFRGKFSWGFFSGGFSPGGIFLGTLLNIFSVKQILKIRNT